MDENTPIQTDAILDALRRAFEETDAPGALLEVYARHAGLVLETNRHLNLTRITEPDDMAVKHYLDSWQLRKLHRFDTHRVLDLGTGAGFPGIPLAAAIPDAQWTLIDGTRKKIDFVKRCIEELGLDNATAEWERAELHLRHARYNDVIARAVGRLSKLLTVLQPVRRSFRRLLCMKGPSWAEELEEARSEGLLKDFPKQAIHQYDLPGGAGQRALLIFRGGR